MISVEEEKPYHHPSLSIFVYLVEMDNSSFHPICMRYISVLDLASVKKTAFVLPGKDVGLG